MLDATYEVVPEAAQAALTAAQQLDMERKKKAVKAVINQAVTVASGIGAVPIPFTDAALLVPNQVTMIARISAAYGLPPQRSRAMAVAGSLILTGGATMAGRYVVTNLLKFIPGGDCRIRNLGHGRRVLDPRRWSRLGEGLRIRLDLARRSAAGFLEQRRRAREIPFGTQRGLRRGKPMTRVTSGC